jgi:thioredoxin 1
MELKRGSINMPNIVNVTDNNFDQEVLQASVLVLVDLWAEWCGPCRMMGPIIDDISDEYVGKVKFTKLNVDENQETASKYNIRGIPTFLLFKNGELVATHVGALPKGQLESLLNTHLGK